ncbi:isochorismatase family protein [Aeromicrobium wangtongii]|uniref:isochorismatase family protein n=1 Tax=Aeromicrobium wangtongii TaxID=2969247 RepID=UPI002017BA2D|nr:isochorismatase family protein [Aeromicrobium wangtongii]MCL3818929.1 isochorismatase family protein [Aeromicrobium wangtongii]
MTDREEPFGAALEPGRRPAVVAVDLVRAYFEPQSPLFLDDRSCLEQAARVLGAARASGVPVLHTQVRYASGGADGGVFFRKVPALRHLVGDGPWGQPMDEVRPLDDEVVVVKQYASAFFGTSLASTLISQAVDTLVVVGVSTSGCVRATAVDAVQHGFVPLVVSDAVGDRTRAVHEANLYDLRSKYAEVMDADDICSYLRTTGTTTP